jgi:hypothetical protein
VRGLYPTETREAAATTPFSALAAQPHRFGLVLGGGVQVVHVAADEGGEAEQSGRGPGLAAPPAIAFVPVEAAPYGSLFLLVEGAAAQTAQAFARRVQATLAAERGVATSRLIRAVGAGCQAVERQVLHRNELAGFGCTALLLDPTLQRYAYVSQLPPCQAYLWDGSQLLSLPEEPMLRAGQVASVEGRSFEVELDVSRLPFRAGTTLLLCPATVGASLAASGVRDILRSPLSTAAGELRRLLRGERGQAPTGGEALLVRSPEAEKSSRVRLFAAPVETPARPAPVRRGHEKVAAVPTGRRPALQKWGLERDRSGAGAWLTELASNFGGELQTGYLAKRRTRRRTLALGGAGLIVAAAASGVGWYGRARPASEAPRAPAAEAVVPAAPPALAGRSLLQGSGRLWALTPGAPGGPLFVVDGAERFWRVSGQEATPLSLTRPATGGLAPAAASPAAGAGMLTRREDTVLWLDANRALWGWRDGEATARPLAIRDPGAWRRPVAMTTYGSNLYVLDAGEGAAAGQIWRYLPSADGAYDTSPQPWLQTDGVLLRGATSFAIDGAIWVGREDGAVLRLLAGRQEPFTPSLLAAPVSFAAAVFTAAGYRSIYVFDAGARRLLRLTRGGQLEREVRDVTLAGDPFRGLWVDEAGNRALLLTEQRLQEVPLGSASG